MRLVLAEAMGMCFGVRDAIDLALSEVRSAPLTVLGELVHNPLVVARLRAAGVEMVRSADELIPTRRVLVSAHGTSDVIREALRARGHDVIEATCPLVSRVHVAARRLVAQGFHVAIIGLAEHTEVRGVVGELAEATVVFTEEDVEQLRGHPRIGVVAQTTQPLPRVLALVRQMRQRLSDSEVRFVDTICQPTKDRQACAERLAAQVPVVVVIGAAHSNNTRELAETCTRMGARVLRISSAQELQPDWFEGVDAVGVTAGTSVPDDVIDGVVRALVSIGEARALETDLLRVRGREEQERAATGHHRED